MNGSRNTLVFVGMIIAAIGVCAHPTQAAVVVCVEQFTAQSTSCPVPWTSDALGLLVTARQQDEQNPASASSTSLLIESSGAPSRPLPERATIELKSIGVPSGMAPNTSSLTQGNGSGSGFALAQSFDSASPGTPLTTILAESRMILPRGPVWRWFRPPRI